VAVGVCEADGEFERVDVADGEADIAVRKTAAPLLLVLI
jgi:hypothetical protein